jgi:twitching motility protein PilT
MSDKASDPRVFDPRVFDFYIEKAVLQNKLVSQEKVDQAKTFQSKKPELSLLDILLKAGLIKAQHAQILKARFEEKNRSEPPSPESAGRSIPKETAVTAPFDDPPAFYETKSDKPSQPVHNADLKEYLNRARKAGASDLHISAGAPILIRKNGRLAPMEQRILPSEETEHLLFGILDRANHKLLKERLFLETCVEVKGQGRYRSCFVKQRCGWDGSFRVIPAKVPTFAELGLPENLHRFTEYRQGLVLVAGPSGAGKSSTVASMIELINRNRSEHVITLEDPIEYVFTPAKAHISQRQIGDNTASFGTALRSALREDPDVILIGELRDLETAALAITAAETGHLVLATLHTTGVEQTIYRLLDFFPPDQQKQVRSTISESIRGIVCQRLIPRKDGKGRVLALEIMFNIAAVSSLIREDRVYQMQNMMKINHTKGMVLMSESIQKLLEKNVIDEMEAHYAFIDEYLFQKAGPGR